MRKNAKRIVWDDLLMVKVIAENGGLSRAAGRLGLAASTLFRRLDKMEESLEMPVFDRHRSGYVPTPAGEELLALAARIDDEVTSVARRLAGQRIQPRGELSITTNDIFLTQLLTPLFATFTRRYPEVRLKVVVRNSALNLARRDADIAIRATDHPPENLVGIKVARAVWTLYGRSSNTERSGRTPPMKEQCWVVLSDELADHASSRFVRASVPAACIVYAVDSVSALAEAIEAGIGVGYLPCMIGDARPGLMRLGELAPALGNNLWLLTHPDLRRSARVRVMLDFLSTELSRLRPLIEGEQPRAASAS